MGLSIHTNFSSLVTQNQLNSTNKMLGTAMQRLGTGMRINSAADDAAGLQIATRLQSQSNSQKIGMRNAQDAISMMQTAEGAMDEMGNIVQRMKDLATQAASATSSEKDIAAMNAEFGELTKELKNIASNTTFGGENLLDKTNGKFTKGEVTFQIGGADGERLTLALGDTLKKVVGGRTLTAAEQGISTDVTTKKGALKTATDAFNTENDKLPALQLTLTDAEKALLDNTDSGKTAGLQKAVTDAKDALSKQEEAIAPKKSDMEEASKEFDAATAKLMTVGDGLDSETLKTGLKSQKHAQAAIGELETFLQDITSVRSSFGANINRLNHTINNLSNMKENTDMANGRIMDADFAAESTNMTKNQMLMQAGMSVLSNANQMTGMVTSLLR